MISPKRRRKQGRFKDLITYYTPKSPGDPWTLVQSPHPVNLVVANWEPGVKHTGWLGEGSLQRGVYVSITCCCSVVCFSLYIKGATAIAEFAFVQHKSNSAVPNDIEDHQLSTLQLAGLATEWARKFWGKIRQNASDSWIQNNLLGISILPYPSKHYNNRV